VVIVVRSIDKQVREISRAHLGLIQREVLFAVLPKTCDDDDWLAANAPTTFLNPGPLMTSQHFRRACSRRLFRKRDHKDETLWTEYSSRIVLEWHLFHQRELSAKAAQIAALTHINIKASLAI
jgi:hypothetical protein